MFKAGDAVVVDVQWHLDRGYITENDEQVYHNGFMWKLDTPYEVVGRSEWDFISVQHSFGHIASTYLFRWTLFDDHLDIKDYM